MDLQLNAPIQAQPDEIRQLFDPERPLPPEVWFQPYQTSTSTFLKHLILTGLFLGGVVGGSLACMLVGLTGTLLDGTSKIRDVGDVLVVSCLYIGLVGLLFIVARTFGLPLWYEALAVRDQRAGVLRRGILLTPDVMVIRLKTSRCDLLPRDKVLKVERWGTRSKTWSVVYRAADGKESRREINFPPFEGFVRELPAVDHIRKWAGLRGTGG